MKKIKLTMLAALLFLTNATQGQITKTINGFNHIESVVSEGKYIYVADIGKKLEPTAKDGDGQIIKMDRKGNIIDSHFNKEKLHAPKGLAINKTTLFLNDIDRVVAIDLNSGNTLYEIDFGPTTTFLNDIAVWDNQTLFVSATDKSQLFKVNLTDKSFSEIKTDVTIGGINGLFCYKKANRLYVNGFGTDNQPNGIIGYVNLKDNHFTRLTNLEGYFDGIYISKDVIYVSNWMAFEKKGTLIGIDLFSNRSTVIKNITQIAGPADFMIQNDQLLLPAMMSGELHFISLDPSLSLKM